MGKAFLMNFGMMTYDNYERGDCFGAWCCRHSEEIETRKYNELDSAKTGYVMDWVYAHREEIRNLTLEEQEEMMIAEGVIIADDI